MRTQQGFRFALAASLLLHLLLLWPVFPAYRQGDAGQALSVVLRPQKGAFPDKISSSRTAAPAVAHSQPRPSAGESAPRLLAESVASSPQRAVVPAAAGNTPASTMETGARSESRAAGASAAGGPGAAPAGAAGLDADGVRQYRVALAAAAGRFKRYPPQAQADEVGGTVEVRISVAEGGRAREVALARSSGHGELDEAAMEMMRKAAPRTAVPELLRQHAFVISLPVVFDPASE